MKNTYLVKVNIFGMSKLTKEFKKYAKAIKYAKKLENKKGFNQSDILVIELDENKNIVEQW